MLEFCKDEYDISSCQSMDPNSTHVPYWVSTKSQIQQSSTTISGNLSLKMGNPTPCGDNAKKLAFLFQDQDSSSTQSTGQSYHEPGSIGESNSCTPNIMFPVPGQLKSISSIGNQGLVPSQANFGQSFACLPIAYADPFYGGILTPTMIQHPHTVGIGPARVPLPLDFPENEAIYVNAKQYHAILRRRKYRSKLEAQNKVAKARKPYLHESRHLHAIKRARGSGGRFINTKSIQDPNSINTVKPSFTAPQIHVAADIPNSNLYHSDVYENRFLARSGSDISTSGSINENVYQQHNEIRFSLYGDRNQCYLAVNQ